MKRSIITLVSIVVAVSLLVTLLIRHQDVKNLQKQIAERDRAVEKLEKAIAERDEKIQQYYMITLRALDHDLDSLTDERLTEAQRQDLQQQALQYLLDQQQANEQVR